MNEKIRLQILKDSLDFIFNNSRCSNAISNRDNDMRITSKEIVSTVLGEQDNWVYIKHQINFNHRSGKIINGEDLLIGTKYSLQTREIVLLKLNSINIE